MEWTVKDRLDLSIKTITQYKNEDEDLVQVMGQKLVNDESLTQKTILKDSRNMTVTLILAYNDFFF